MREKHTLTFKKHPSHGMVEIFTDKQEKGIADVWPGEYQNYFSKLFNAAPEMLMIIKSWTIAMWQAGIESDENSLDPLKSMLFKAEQIIGKVEGESEVN